MTEATALGRHPKAVKVRGTELRTPPENDDERRANTTSTSQADW